MSLDPRVQEMLDHHEIRKTLAEYCHACDRADEAMMAATYTAEGSFDDHGHVKASGPDMAATMTRLALERTEAASHILGQSLIEVDGDEARTETFFIAFFRLKGGDGRPVQNQLVGRFVDRLAREYRHRGQTDRALDCWHQLARLNPADEETRRALMAALAGAGQRAEALHQYQLLTALLRRELHVAPLPETTRLYQAILAGRTS